MQTVNTNTDYKYKLVNSLLYFTQIFYFLRTGRKFDLSFPDGRESHYITICRELTNVFDLKTNRLVINVPPGHGKSTLLQHFIAWAMAQYPDSNFLYISYSKSLAEKHTATIKQIMQMREYQELFGIEISDDSSAKGNFKTTAGGSVMAFGSSGSITGQDAGLPNCSRFSGGVIIDDAHKPDEVHSDTMRQSVLDNYNETIKPRPRGENVPIVFLGQCLHEDDLASYLKSGKDGFNWHKVVLKAIDEAGNALCPNINSLKMLRREQETNPYVFAAQYQQDPQPAGGGIFKPEWFALYEFEPEILATFITVDTAETSKEYNDATVFSFWGLYKVKHDEIETDEYALHCIDCLELRVEPKDLKNEFLQFYASASRHRIKPKIVAIEKKSTGTTLVSILKDYQGIQLLAIERTRESGSKIKRFLETQPYVAERLISLPMYGRHTQMFIEHMRKITSNDTHRWDDVCFIAGTKIATLFGYKNIEDIKINDLIITPFGINKVIECGLTGYKQIISRMGLNGTASHKIFCDNSYKRLDTLKDGDKIDKLSFNGLLQWKYRKLLFLMESNINLQVREDIILAGKKMLKKEKVLKDFMWRFGNFIVERQFLKAMWFIIKITIILIMTMLTWNVFRVSNTLNNMQMREEENLLQKKNYSIWKKFVNKLKNGIVVKRVVNGIEKMLKLLFLRYSMIENSIVLSAGKNSLAEIILQPYAPNYAWGEIEEKNLRCLNQIALNVEKSLKQKNRFLNQGIEKHVQDYALEEQKKVPVYNLTVDKMQVYYANNVLVSNCDTVADAVRIALIDKTIINKISSKMDDNSAAKSLYNIYNKIGKLKSSAYS